RAHSHLPSFPTRRSSDLWWPRYGLPRNRLTNTDYLFATGIAPDTNGATLVVQTRAGAQASVPVQAVSANPAMTQVYQGDLPAYRDRKSTRLNSSHVKISY